MQKKTYLILSLVIALMMILAACGGGGGGDSSDMSDAAKAGKAVFEQDIIGTQAGCKTCHSLEPDKVIVGPSLAGIATRAATRVPGMSAENYIRQSILDPEAYLVEGFPSGTMPQVWDQELSDQQLNDLVAFLMTEK